MCITIICIYTYIFIYINVRGITRGKYCSKTPPIRTKNTPPDRFLSRRLLLYTYTRGIYILKNPFFLHGQSAGRGTAEKEGGQGKEAKKMYVYSPNPLCRALYRPPSPTRRSARSNEQF